MNEDSKSNSYVWGILIILFFILKFSFSSNSSAIDERYGTYEDKYPASSYEESNGYNKYGCTSDCSGHNAGYEWAEENGISDSDDCGGNSDSFIEGCESYAEDNQDSYEEDSYEYEDYNY